MILYDFSVYAERRKEVVAAKAVLDAASSLDKPGSIILLKNCVTDWFSLHKTVISRV